MSKWIDFSIDERMAMVYAVTQTKRIDEAAAEKDWWVTFGMFSSRSNVSVSCFF